MRAEEEALLVSLCEDINAKLWAAHQEECARSGRYSGWSPFNPDAHRSVRVTFELFGVAGLHFQLAAQAATIAEQGWRCFHCEEVFADKAKAREHFGHSLLAEAACTIEAKRLRELEQELERYRAEDSDLDRKYHAMEADHAVAVRRAEEAGYDKGLVDGQKLVAEHEATISRRDEELVQWKTDHAAVVKMNHEQGKELERLREVLAELVEASNEVLLDGGLAESTTAPRFTLAVVAAEEQVKGAMKEPPC